jgi:hypothetical protein
MLSRILGLGLSALVGLSLLGALPTSAQEPESPPLKKKGLPVPRTKKETVGREGDTEADLQRAYGLLRRLRADASTRSQTDGRIRDWIERATRYYGEGVRAYREQNPQLAQQDAAIAHDLARAIDHTCNAALFDRPDESLPPPPARAGSGREAYARRSLEDAYERLREGDDGSDAGLEAKYYREAATTLYRDARRDFEAGRLERAGELARAAQAMRSVCEHLGLAADLRVLPAPKAERKTGRSTDRS